MSEDRFIDYLRALPRLAEYDTGKIAAYRRACGQRLAGSDGCQDFVAISTRADDFLTVTLAAQYSSDRIRKREHDKKYASRGSIGAAWAAYCKKKQPEEDPHTFYGRRQEDLAAGRPPKNVPSLHERFRTMLDADLERDATGELAYRLRGLVRMLVAEEIPMDVIQLAHDLRSWRVETRCVQERWARAFYAPPYAKPEAAGPSDESEGDIDDPESLDAEDENAD